MPAPVTEREGTALVFLPFVFINAPAHHKSYSYLKDPLTSGHRRQVARDYCTSGVPVPPLQAAPGSGVWGPCSYLERKAPSRGSLAFLTCNWIPQAEMTTGDVN